MLRRNHVVAIAGVLAAPLLASPCQAASGCQNLGGAPIHFGVDWQTEIKPILQDYCVGCHSFGSTPDFSDIGIDAIFKIVNTYAQPGNPAASRLFVKINCSSPDGGQQMPLGDPPLSFMEQALIFDWIDQGALGENPPGAIDRDFIVRDSFESLRRPVSP